MPWGKKTTRAKRTARGTRKAEGPGSRSARLLCLNHLQHFSSNPDFCTVLPNRPSGRFSRGLAPFTSLDCSPRLPPCKTHGQEGAAERSELFPGPQRYRQAPSRTFDFRDILAPKSREGSYVYKTLCGIPPNDGY